MPINHHSAAIRATKSMQSGFTLLEILMVVFIIGLLAALVVPNLAGQAQAARRVAAASDLRAIANALELYQLDNFTYPSTEQGLQALVEEPLGQPEANGWRAAGYLRKLPKDPWGNPYLYLSPGSEGAYDLFSTAADGKPGGSGEAADVDYADL